MGRITGYDAQVLRNGTAIPFRFCKVTRSRDKASISWQIDLADVVNITADDTWTIKRGIGGALQTLVDNGVCENVSGEDGTGTYTRSIRSPSSGSDAFSRLILSLCIPKTLVFFHPDWLDEVAKGAKLDNDGVIRMSNVNGMGQTIGTTRFYHDRLPGKDFRDTDFVCIPAKTHQEVSRYLCGLVGAQFFCNVPDLEIVDTNTYASGTAWFEAIVRNLKIWSPDIKTVDTEIRVADVLVETEEDEEPIHKLRIDNPGIISTSWSAAGSGSSTNEPKDHLIVVGRQSKNTSGVNDPEPDYTPIELTAVPYEIDEEFTEPVSITPVKNKKLMGEYEGTWGTGDEEFQPKPVTLHEKVNRFHVEQKRGTQKKRYLMQEETVMKSEDGEIQGKIVITHYWSKDFRPVYSTEEEYVLCKFPGSDTKELRRLSNKITDQSQVVKSINQALTSELLEEVVLYDENEAEETKEDPKSYRDVIRQDQSRTMIDVDPDTTQKTLEMTTKTKQSFIDRSSNDMLIKREVEQEVISGAVRFNSQILENPLRDQQSSSKDDQYRKEFYDGAGTYIGTYGPCYHAPTTISHEDITNDTTAAAIAARFFKKYGVAATSDQYEVVVKTPVPIPIDTVDFPVTIPDFTVVRNGLDVTVPGGDFKLHAVSETMGADGKGNIIEDKYEQVLTLRVS